MRKVLFFAENLGSGGAERQQCGLAISLKKRGYEVKVIAYVNKLFYGHLLQENNVAFELHEELMNPLKRIFGFIKLIKNNKPDVVISFLPGPNKAACLAKLLYNYKLIVGERNTNLSIKISDRLRFNLYRIANAVVPNSVAQGEFIAGNFGFLNKKTYPIANFVDLKVFRPPTIHHNNEIPVIITVARFTEQKNLLRYIEAIAIVIRKGFKGKFIFYGNHSDTQYFIQMKKLTKELFLDPYISMYEPDSNIAERYRESDVLCLPSIYEGYPNVLCEAMSTELPVLCSNVFEMSKIVKEGINGFLFDPYSPDDIARAIMKYLESSKEECMTMGKLNRKQIKMNNTISVFADKYIDLIEKIIGQ